jgi:hypothetical protein
MYASALININISVFADAYKILYAYGQTSCHNPHYNAPQLQSQAPRQRGLKNIKRSHGLLIVLRCPMFYFCRRPRQQGFKNIKQFHGMLNPLACPVFYSCRRLASGAGGAEGNMLSLSLKRCDAVKTML